MVGRGLKRFTDMVGNKQGNTTGVAMGEYRFHGLPEVLERRHVVNGVMNEDDIKLASQPQCPHIAFQVLTLRIESATHGQHLW